MDSSDDASTAPETFIDKFGFLTLTPTVFGLGQLRDNARLEKWQEMLSRWEFMLRSRRSKLKKRTRKGIPDCLRGKIWYDFAGCDSVRSEIGPELYTTLVESLEISPYEAQIQKDVYRTFPKHIFFRAKAGQDSLYRILRAYSLHNRVIGYCQGMGFLAGLFLMYMSEESVFWMLETLMTRYRMQGLYVPGMPEVYLSIYISQALGLTFLTKTFQHLQSVNLSASLYATNWFMTLFACVFKFETVLRIWDCFFFEGRKIVFRVLLGLVKLCKTEIRDKSFEEALEAIKEKAQTVGPDELFQSAFSFRLSRSKLEQLEKEFASHNNPMYLQW